MRMHFLLAAVCLVHSAHAKKEKKNKKDDGIPEGALEYRKQVEQEGLKNMTEARLRALQSKMDLDSNGTSTLEEGLEFVVKNRMKKAKLRHRRHCSILDADKDGKTLWKDMRWDLEWKEDKYPESQHAAIQKVFDSYKKEGEDYLREDELLEFVVYLDSGFRMQDTDNDGFMSFQEFVIGKSDNPDRQLLDKRKEQFDLIDLDKDGKLTSQEHYPYAIGIPQGKKAIISIHKMVDHKGRKRDGIDHKEIVKLKKKKKFAGSFEFRQVEKWLKAEMLDEL